MNTSDDDFVSYWAEACNCEHARAMHMMDGSYCATPVCPCKKYAMIQTNGTRSQTTPAE